MQSTARFAKRGSRIDCTVTTMHSMVVPEGVQFSDRGVHVVIWVGEDQQSGRRTISSRSRYSTDIEYVQYIMKLIRRIIEDLRFMLNWLNCANNAGLSTNFFIQINSRNLPIISIGVLIKDFHLGMFHAGVFFRREIAELRVAALGMSFPAPPTRCDGP